MPIEDQKRTVFQKIRKGLDGQFSYCCANPPYVGEKGNKELFRATMERFPYWQEFYQGKMDYLYFFITLGFSKLEEGGKLGFITTAYWPTADGASKLRSYILRNAKIKEMIFFEDVKIFEYAKGQHNMVFVLERCSGEEKKVERAENRIKVARVLAKHQEIPGDTIREKLKFLTKHIEEHIDKDECQDEYIKVFWSGVKQGELPKDGGAWNNLFISRDSRTLLSRLEQRAKPLEHLCDIIRGVDSSADRVTQQNISALPATKIEQFGIKNGDGIFLLTENEKDSLQLSPNELELVKPTYKNSDICPYFVDIDEKLFIIYVGKNTQIDLYPNIRNHLEEFREILENRGGHTKGEPDWYSLHRIRNEKLLRSKKIVCSRWGEKGPDYFSFQTGEYYEGTDTRVIVPKDSTQEDILYILAILNSRLTKKWMIEMAQRRGYTAQSALLQIPIRRIDFDNAEDVRMHDEIVEKVETIRGKMAELAGYSKYFRGARLTRLKIEDPLPDVSLEAIIHSLPPEKRFSLRTHPEIKINYGSNFEKSKFILNKVRDVFLTLEGPELKLHGKAKQVISLNGEEGLLKIIVQISKDHKGETWSSIKEMPLIPQSAEDLEAQRRKILSVVSALRGEIRGIQDSIDKIVFNLYGVPEFATENATNFKEAENVAPNPVVKHGDA